MGLQIIGSAPGSTGATGVTVHAGTAAARPAAAAAVNWLYFASDTFVWSFSDGAAWATINTEVTVHAGTAAARPAAAAAVNWLYGATDTGNLSYSNGAAWTTIVAGSTLWVPKAGTYAAAGTDVVTATVAGDAAARYVLNADGSQEWGTGAGATDTTLARSGAGALTLTGALTMTSQLLVHDVIIADGTIQAGGDVSSPTGAVEGATVAATGLVGAVAASRDVGATATGHPVAGAFDVGDRVTARDGHLWICVAAGVPGTWVDISPAPMLESGSWWPSFIGSQVGVDTRADGFLVSYPIDDVVASMVFWVSGIGVDNFEAAIYDAAGTSQLATTGAVPAAGLTAGTWNEVFLTAPLTIPAGSSVWHVIGSDGPGAAYSFSVAGMSGKSVVHGAGALPLPVSIAAWAPNTAAGGPATVAA